MDIETVMYEVKNVGIETVIPDQANLRKHEAKSIEAIKQSLSRFGQKKPLVLDRDGICRAGNGTLIAAKELGWTHIAVHRTDLSGSEAIAFAIADNRTAELSEWEKEGLADTLAALRTENPDFLKAIAFESSDVDKMLRQTAAPLSFQAGLAPETAVGVTPASMEAEAAKREDAPAPTSHVRMVQVFYNETTFAAFTEYIEKLAKQYGLDNTSDTVLEALKREASRTETPN